MGVGKLEDIPITLSFELMQDLWTTNLEGMQFQLQSEKKRNLQGNLMNNACFFLYELNHQDFHATDFNNSFYKIMIVVSGSQHTTKHIYITYYILQYTVYSYTPMYNQPGFGQPTKIPSSKQPHVSFKRWISAATVGRAYITRLTVIRWRKETSRSCHCQKLTKNSVNSSKFPYDPICAWS